MVGEKKECIDIIIYIVGKKENPLFFVIYNIPLGKVVFVIKALCHAR